MVVVGEPELPAGRRPGGCSAACQGGDVVILSPRGKKEDYIKRVIGLPGDTIELVGGALYINGKAVKREPRPAALIPVDANVPCTGDGRAQLVRGAGEQAYCRMPVVRETLPEGRSFDTTTRLRSGCGDFEDPVRRPRLVMGDTDQSADRASRRPQGLAARPDREYGGGTS